MNKFFQKGLTLIELMTVVTMIIIVTGVVFANYGVGRDSMALERSSQKLYQDIRFAVSSAMAGAGDSNGVGIHFDTAVSNTKYIIFKNSTNNTFSPSVNTSVNIFPTKGLTSADWIKLEDGVKIYSLKDSTNSLVNSLDVFFLSPYPTTYLNGVYKKDKNGCSPQASCVVSIVLSNLDGTRTKTITVNNSGMIDLK